MSEALARQMVQFGDYMPHGMCLLWQPWLVVLWAGSDLLIFLSYMAIPFALLTVLRKRRDIPFSGIVVLFASFILLCGLTHLFGIVTLWMPIYPIVGWLKLATGLVSMATAIVLFRMIPQLVALPSPAALAEVNAELTEARDTLEAKVKERTAELAAANASLAIQAREAVHRSNNLLTVVGSLARQSARGSVSVDEYVDTFTGRVEALAGATASVMRGEDETSELLDKIVRRQLEPTILAYPDKIRIEGPPVRIGSEAAQQIGLALHELATNAQKYGALGDDEGGIDIEWTIERGADARPLFVLTWAEMMTDEARRAFGSKRTGFGTKLLTRIVPTMLRGRAAREIVADRFVYRLEIGLEELAAGTKGSKDEALAARIVDENFGD
ncbi:sensor histidine kinase [Sphingomicrobium sediminis]|uniref:histidine kinase n=1 Tax=Sphingomicrobium sediminis TaxID=2950949 RepID=A0A9X2J238_9SPHN|nr:sensor histidine kinase [Sphingomicrobium sediminis]MCM8557409.1 sensor histidine kinase [Sphingomicrobium sediminis]